MCSRQEVKEEILSALKVNSKQRDENLDNKLHELKVEIFEKVDASINNRINHLTTSPTTAKKLGDIDVLCAKRGEQIISMKDDIKEIKEIVKSISQRMNEELEKKTDKEVFYFWRNLLVSGMFLAIFMAVIGLAIEKLLG